MIKRKKMLIAPRFQATVVLYSFTLSLLTLVVFYAGYCFSYFKSLKTVQAMDMPFDINAFLILSQQTTDISMIFFGTVALSLVVNLLCGIIFSHRLVGPLYRLKTHLALCANEQALKKVTFRRKDYFQDVAVSFNEFTESYSKNRAPDEASRDC